MYCPERDLKNRITLFSFSLVLGTEKKLPILQVVLKCGIEILYIVVTIKKSSEFCIAPLYI